MFIEIYQRRIGQGYPIYIVAEMSANHCQNYDRAVKIIEAAKNAGADAIKLQTYSPDSHTINSNKSFFRIDGGTLWDGYTLYDLYGKAFMPWKWQPELKKIANQMGLDLFSAAVDNKSLDFLEKMDVPVHKVSSFEIVDLPLIEKISLTGKPLIISTGMASISEIEEAVNTAREFGAEQILLLKCSSAYPANPEEINLKTIPHLADAFHVPVGLSDHTTGIAVPVTSVAFGACMIEKHFTLSRSIPGPDSAFSLEPHEFKEMVHSVRIAEKAIGKVNYSLGQNEVKSYKFRRSLFAVKNIKCGDLFTHDNIRSIRPGHGLPVRYMKRILGCRASKDIEFATPLDWDMIKRET